jgi:peptide/nickel transport system permease protein
MPEADAQRPVREVSPVQVRRVPAEPSLVIAPGRSRGRLLTYFQFGVAVLIAFVLISCALFPHLLAPYDPSAMALESALKGPSAQHWFGTDQLGRDQLSRVIWGSRVSLLIAFSAVAMGGIFGGLFGIAAGYLGGAVDSVAMRLVDIQLALPAVILALVLVGAVGFSIFNLIVILSLAHWARYARVTRSEALSLKQREFVLLARLAGASPLRVIIKHITPNVISTFIVLATLDIGTIMILEASLSFLGLGVQPPDASWGSMIADGRGFLQTAWWICAFPGVALMAAVLSANLLGDTLRDWLNPTMSRAW